MASNFSPGPAALPRAVRERISAELDDWAGTGTSVMELSHRGRPFRSLAEASIERCRRLLSIPATHHVALLQGGASTQFALLALNHREGGRRARYATDGHWGQKALEAAACLRACEGCAREELAAAVEEAGADYVHVTTNETVDGLQWTEAPRVAPLVACDMSSDIASGPRDFAPYDLAYAGAQKNLGIAGITLVVLSDRWLDACRDDLPVLLSHRALLAAESMANTPPTFAWYVFDLVLQWIEAQGGLVAIAERNRQKAGRLYAALDASDFYHCPVPAARRSAMNVVFRTPSPERDAAFVAAAEAEGLHGLKGHRAVGGLRASLYNAIEPADVEALVAFLRTFEGAS